MYLKSLSFLWAVLQNFCLFKKQNNSPIIFCDSNHVIGHANDRITILCKVTSVVPPNPSQTLSIWILVMA